MVRFSLIPLLLIAGASASAEVCDVDATLNPGVLTLATGNPAFFPWVIDDAPESGDGFEPAVAYEMAERMGFDADDVKWVRTSFDEAIQPGAKDFDANFQQFSITPERQKVVDFSAPYYSAAMAVLTTKSVEEANDLTDIAGLKELKWGVAGGSTAVQTLEGIIEPDSDPLVYNDNTDVTAAIQARQIDAALFDLPTALYLAAVVVNDGVIAAQFAADRSQSPDEFGAILPKGSALKPCFDEALKSMRDDGTLAEIEQQWLATAVSVPVLK